MVIILLHDNVQPHLDRMTLQKVIDLGYEILPHPPYSSNVSLTNYHLFKHLNTLCQKTFSSKGEVETAFKDFLASELLEFYCTGLNNLLNWCQKYVDVQGSYFDWLNTLFKVIHSGTKVHYKIGKYFLNNSI